MGSKIKKLLIMFCVLATAVFILSNPSAASDGAVKGILLCGRVAIPFLFPMSFLTIMLCKLANGGLFSVWLLSLISGYPVGARLIKSRFSAGVINVTQAKRGMLFCVNAGPAFIVTAVGYSCLRNIKLGWLLLAAHIIGSAILFLIFKKDILKKSDIKLEQEKILDIFTESAYESAEAMLQICGWIILFSSFCQVLKDVNLPDIIKNTLLATAEITSAVTIYRSPLILSFLLGFGGFCVHFQVLSAGREIRPNYLIFLLSRIIHGGISAGLCYLLLKCFPIALETASIEISNANKNSPIAFCSLLFTLVVFAFSVKNYNKV